MGTTPGAGAIRDQIPVNNAGRLPSSAVTPVDVDRLANCLLNHPDVDHVRYVIEGLREGFDLGFRGRVVETWPNNLRNTRECPGQVLAAIQKEIERGHTSGPFSVSPFDVTHCSPLGAVGKPDGSVRLILDLSSPRGCAINEGISQEEFACEYSHFDQAVDMVRGLGRGCYMSKLDVKHAFRLCPVRPDQWHLLCYQWEGFLYVDTRLPFGGRSSPFIFNSFAQLLCWIFVNVGRVALIMHYLDDFFTANGSEEGCRENRDMVVSLCAHLNVPLAPEKIIGPFQVLTFLGIEIDSVNMQIRLPADKLQKLREKIRYFLGRKKVTLEELLSLIGSLNFASTVVKPGRTFVRRLIDLSTTVRSLHHYVSLNEEARKDILWWDEFVSQWNGVSLIPSPLRSSPDMELYTDASDIGFGCVYGREWAYGVWPEGWKGLSINAREGFAIWVAVKLWGQEWRDGQIVIHTDSQVMTEVWKKGTCRDKDVMRVVRPLFMLGASINLSITLLHVPGVDNVKADLLSRFKIQEFRTRFAHMSTRPTVVPPEVWLI